MNYTLDTESIISSIRKLQMAYEEESKVPKYTNRTIYRDTKRSDYDVNTDFYQIGQKTIVQIGILENDLSHLFYDRALKRLIKGEEHHILKELEQKSNIESRSVSGPSFSDFQDWCKFVRSPDHLFLPSDEDVRKSVLEWRNSGQYRFSRNEIVANGVDAVKIHWIPSSYNITSGYLISSHDLEVEQKWYEESKEPKKFEYDERFERASYNRPLTVYIGDVIEEASSSEVDGPKIEILYRTILSNIVLKNNNALRINFQV